MSPVDGDGFDGAAPADDDFFPTGLAGPRTDVGLRDRACPKDLEQGYTLRGAKRCARLVEGGERCQAVAVIPTSFCVAHGGLANRASMMATRDYGSLLKGEALRTAFSMFMADPDILDVRAELALQRTLLVDALSRLPEGPDELGTLDMGFVAAVTHLNDAVARLADVAVKLESRAPTSISMSQVSWVISQVCDAVLDAVEAEIDGDVSISDRQFNDDSRGVDPERRTRPAALVRRRIAARVSDCMEALVVPSHRGNPKAPVDVTL